MTYAQSYGHLRQGRAIEHRSDELRFSGSKRVNIAQSCNREFERPLMNDYQRSGVLNAQYPTVGLWKRHHGDCHRASCRPPWNLECLSRSRTIRRYRPRRLSNRPRELIRMRRIGRDEVQSDAR